MLSMLSSWQGNVEINGISYDTVKSAISAFKPSGENISIRLYPVTKTAVKTDDKDVVEGVTHIDTPQASTGEIKITVKKYMTEPASPSFDFMAKWNNDRPMPMRIMQGTVEKETRGMVYMKLHGLALATVTCSCCGKPLTNPVSRHYGIGPICLSKIGIARDIEDIQNIKEDLVNVTWEGWIIKSAITDREEV